MAARRDVDEIHLAVQLLGYLDALFDAVAALIAGRAADAHVDGVLGAAEPSDAFYDGEQQSTTIFKAATPFVLTIVHLGVQELIEQPTVPGVDGHQPESAELGEGRRIRVGLDGLQDDVLRHGRDGHPHGVHTVHSPVDLVAPERREIGVRAAVLQLDGRDSPVTVDGRRQTVDGGQGGRVVQVSVAEPDAAALAVGNRRTHVHGGPSPKRLALEEGYGLFERVVLRGQVFVTHRRREQPALKDGVAQADG